MKSGRQRHIGGGGEFGGDGAGGLQNRLQSASTGHLGPGSLGLAGMHCPMSPNGGKHSISQFDFVSNGPFGSGVQVCVPKMQRYFEGGGGDVGAHAGSHCALVG